ncbi:unnamed protein product, partial [Mesorhabditis belari]|uniref:Uncharacterized protein n=1 Tax=Mesorhabditis belari TaxID=2138241 RepID=A0AAF3EYU5_9BILA
MNEYTKHPKNPGLFLPEKLLQENHETGQSLNDFPERHHWPPWAIVLLVTCVILSAIAFFIGNCINKRTSRTQKTSTKNSVKQKRAWGAGFSGGLWAAA